jgi:hypothetical protein
MNPGNWILKTEELTMNTPERKNSKLKSAMHLFLVLVCVAALGTASLAQKSRSFGAAESLLTKRVVSTQAPEYSGGQPVMQMTGVVDCADIGDFSELKLDFGTPNGTFDFRTYNSGQGPVILTGTQPATASTITVMSSGDTLNSFFSDRVFISAVILKVGNESFIFKYPTATRSDTNLDPGDVQQSISHISFCYGIQPTAADLSVSGRVLTSEGRAVSGARITITDAATGQVFAAITNPFGYYTIEGLESDSFYVARIGKKGMKFVEDTKSFSLVDSMADLDFVTTAP